MRILFTVLLSLAATLAAEPAATCGADDVSIVTSTPGLVAFWDFVKREPGGQRRFTAHVPPGSTNDYPLDAANYIKDYWGAGREATYADFPLLGRGPFGNAIRIVKETDPDFRPFLFVPRERLHDSPLDIKGTGRSVTVVVWAIRESGNHALAGIWHEGTDLKQKETASIAKVERGQRQYALFAGLNQEGSACTIGRVIHSSRSVGFTGWIGGVAVFKRALNADEILRLSDIVRHEKPFSLGVTQ